ncbi:hypothetical protein C7B65_19995 [Phormidesmis priestleyi ULC007]|uniref:Uncharacterized protein n=1 Tax=Phormidesmis priestleyi ULC007 TaxID=1920490 RepID=A0A2T1D914_9CYAN|nr:hypothetical protein [Phormidesmis priestleyi]PSB16982.1 hypothetical protein C7B65_19995 [Phormidesmis priestleyi ULC007]PZO47909.1 MAG: hypothetical protein DCF14_18580 [Phormidesmis priestleyi]
MALNDFREVFLPYCLKKQDDGRYVVLNREYKPIGFKNRENVKYEDYPICVELKGIGSATAAKLSYKGDSSMDNIYLYNDSCVPTESAEHMKNYLKRLEILAKLKVV